MHSVNFNVHLSQSPHHYTAITVDGKLATWDNCPVKYGQRRFILAKYFILSLSNIIKCKSNRSWKLFLLDSAFSFTALTAYYNHICCYGHIQIVSVYEWMSVSPSSKLHCIIQYNKFKYIHYEQNINILLLTFPCNWTD